METMERLTGENQAQCGSGVGRKTGGMTQTEWAIKEESRLERWLSGTSTCRPSSL